MLGLSDVKKVDKFVLDGLSETFEPYEKTLNNIFAFSKAYKHEKSKNIGDVEYLIN